MRMAELPSGWVALGESREWQRILTSRLSKTGKRFYVLYFVAILLAMWIGRWAFDVFGPVPVLVVLGLLVLAAVVAAVYAMTRSPRSEVNFDTGQVRVRGNTLPFDHITEAVYLPVAHKDRVDAFLSLDTHGMPVITVCLRSTHLPELTTQERMLVAEILRRSSVEIPQSKRGRTNVYYDPDGKYEWMRHPNHLSRDDAIEYVLHTPKSGEAWRTPPPKKSIWIDGD